jgi:hypothetical protein
MFRRTRADAIIDKTKGRRVLNLILGLHRAWQDFVMSKEYLTDLWEAMTSLLVEENAIKTLAELENYKSLSVVDLVKRFYARDSNATAPAIGGHDSQTHRHTTTGKYEFVRVKAKKLGILIGLWVGERSFNEQRVAYEATVPPLITGAALSLFKRERTRLYYIAGSMLLAVKRAANQLLMHQQTKLDKANETIDAWQLSKDEIKEFLSTKTADDAAAAVNDLTKPDSELDSDMVKAVQHVAQREFLSKKLGPSLLYPSQQFHKLVVEMELTFRDTVRVVDVLDDEGDVSLTLQAQEALRTNASIVDILNVLPANDLQEKAYLHKLLVVSFIKLHLSPYVGRVTQLANKVCARSRPTQSLRASLGNSSK